MNSLGLSALTLAILIGAAASGRSSSGEAIATSSYPPGCAVAVEGSGRSLPRASVTIENRRPVAVRVRLESRHGLPRTDLGIVAAGESMFVAQMIPAGRNLLQATDREGRITRTVMQVANRGAGTCRRRYLWRIE